MFPPKSTFNGSPLGNRQVVEGLEDRERKDSAWDFTSPLAIDDIVECLQTHVSLSIHIK